MFSEDQDEKNCVINFLYQSLLTNDKSKSPSWNREYLFDEWYEEDIFEVSMPFCPDIVSEEENIHEELINIKNTSNTCKLKTNDDHALKSNIKARRVYKNDGDAKQNQAVRERTRMKSVGIQTTSNVIYNISMERGKLLSIKCGTDEPQGLRLTAREMCQTKPKEKIQAKISLKINSEKFNPKRSNENPPSKFTMKWSNANESDK